MTMNKFIVTFGDRVVLDYTNSPEGVHRLFDTKVKAIEYILAVSGVYFHVDYFEFVVGQMGGDAWCRYTHDWTVEEVVKDVYKKFHHRFEMYKIYSEVSDI